MMSWATEIGSISADSGKNLMFNSFVIGEFDIK
jgi:hypothetical protein